MGQSGFLRKSCACVGATVFDSFIASKQGEPGSVNPAELCPSGCQRNVSRTISPRSLVTLDAELERQIYPGLFAEDDSAPRSVNDTARHLARPVHLSSLNYYPNRFASL